jgi:transposase
VLDDDLLCVGESGFHTSMTRSHARSPRGQRAPGEVPRNRGQNLTLLCGLTLAGPCAAWVVDGGVNADVFLTYLRAVLVPELRVGQVVVMDNLAAHHQHAVRALIEQTGALLVFLPLYSPDFNPIELLFSKLKAAMRQLAARARASVIHALGTALDRGTADDAQAWFHPARSLHYLW